MSCVYRVEISEILVDLSVDFADFDIKIVLLGQNSFEWIAFCWVERCIF